MVEQYESELKHKDWNPYLYSVNDDLNILNALMPQCYDLGKGYTKTAAINLQVFYMARETFIRLPQVINTINKIVAAFHEPSFIKDYARRESSALQFELECIPKLLNCLSQINSRLSDNELIPVVKYRKKKYLDPDFEGAAI